EGSAHVHRTRGMILRGQGRFEEAARDLHLALAFFDRTHDLTETARTQLEIARTRQAANNMPQMITQAYVDALEQAENSRRPDLVRMVEEELKGVDEEAHWRHVYHRARGRGVTEDTTSLSTGSSELATVLFLNLQGFIAFCQGLDPEDVMVTLN